MNRLVPEVSVASPEPWVLVLASPAASVAWPLASGHKFTIRCCQMETNMERCLFRRVVAKGGRVIAVGGWSTVIGRTP